MSFIQNQLYPLWAPAALKTSLPLLLYIDIKNICLCSSTLTSRISQNVCAF